VKSAWRRAARLAGRIGLLGVCATVLAVVAMQFTGIVAKNVAIAREVASSRAEVNALRERERREVQAIRRLSDPRGAIPEIHDRLRLVGAHEEIIYVRGLPAPTAPPDDWGAAGEDGR
jgi:cell division protein FtsB